MELPHDPVIPLINYIPKKMKTDVQTNTCTQIFTALFIRYSKKQKTKINVYQLMNRLANVVCHTMEYYSTIKRNVEVKHATMWMNLENIIQSEKSQSKDHILCDSIYMKCPE